MPRREPLPPEFGNRAFTIRDAATAGIPRSRTRAMDLESPYRGVRSPPGPHDLRTRCTVFASRMPPHQFFSHTTAANLWGLPVPRRLKADTRLHVTAAMGREPRVRGIVGHVTTRPPSVVDMAGLRVESAVDTWCALASILSIDELVVMGDALVRRKSPLATIEHLKDAAARRRGGRGAARLSAALLLIRAGTDSTEETRVRLLIVRAGLPEPLVNHPIRDLGGGFVALGDLSYPDFRVLVEYDGGHHFESAQQAMHDVDRVEAIMALRWRVIRVNKTHSDRWITTKVAAALRDAGWRPNLH